MRYEILYKPTFSLAEITLGAGEAIQAEAGAMAYMSPNVQIETKMKGGLIGAVKRKVLGGESIFMNTFRAEGGEGKLGLAPPYQGDIVHRELKGEALLVQSGSYMASDPKIEIDTKWGGAKTFFGREGLFLLKMQGKGSAFISSFGAIHELELRDESFVVDTGHMVAFTDGLDFKVRKVGGLKSTILSGEGLVAEFKGTGRLYLQTRNVGAFVSWIAPFLPRQPSQRF